MKYTYGNTYYGENYGEAKKASEKIEVIRDEKKQHRPEHYYGDISRRLLIAAGILMLIATPLFSEYLPQPIIISVIAVVLIAFVAGFTSPNQKTVAVANLAVSAFALIAFEAYATYMYTQAEDISQMFFIVSQTLAVIFFIDVYYSAKTVRGMFLNSVSVREKLEEILSKHGKKTEDLRDVFWEAVAGGCSEVTASCIINDPKHLDKYLTLREEGAGNRTAVKNSVY